MAKFDRSSLRECAGELTQPKRHPLLAVGLIAALALGASGCAVRVVKHGNYGGPYNHTEVVLGGGRAISDGLTRVEQAGIPVISGAAAQLNQQRAYVDDQGRTILQVPRQVPTVFCGDPENFGRSRSGADCNYQGPPPNAGFYQQVAPDNARVICPQGASLVTAVDRSTPQNTAYLVCQTGQGGMVSAGMQVNGVNYWLQPPPGAKTTPSSFGAFDAEKVRQRQFSTAGVWLNNNP